MVDINHFEMATYTALVISPPENQWGAIQEIRKKQDKGYDRWMPHISILFPFIKPEQFNIFEDKFKDQIAQLPEFEVTLSHFNHFSHGKSSILWLQPDCKSLHDQESQPIHRIYDLIVSQYPALKDSKKPNFTPHLTVGQGATQGAQKTLQQLQENWQPIVFKCSTVDIIHREGQNVPFMVKKQLFLKQE